MRATRSTSCSAFFKAAARGKKDEKCSICPETRWNTIYALVDGLAYTRIGADAARVVAHVARGTTRVCNPGFSPCALIATLPQGPRSGRAKLCRRPRLCHVEFSLWFVSYIFLRERHHGRCRRRRRRRRKKRNISKNKTRDFFPRLFCTFSSL